MPRTAAVGDSRKSNVSRCHAWNFLRRWRHPQLTIKEPKFKLVSAAQDRKSPEVLRRNKLTGKLDHQISAAKAAIAGDTYAAKRVKFVQDSESGQRRQVEMAVRVKPWWWKSASGKLMLASRYGARPIELAKGKNAIEIGSMGDLVAALEAVKDAVQAGELDAQIEQASGSLRDGFKKK